MNGATDVVVAARDGRLLAATLHLPQGRPRAAVLVAPAMAVRRRFYNGFAGHLASAGLAALVIDYRGIGDSRQGSLRRDPARMTEWGTEDIAGGLAHLRGRFPGLPLLHVGHSGGGWLLGMSDETRHLSGVLTVASQDGHWRHWPLRQRPLMMLFWYLVLPLSVALLRELPGWALGGGESVPAGVARDWGRWGRNPRFIADAIARHGWRGYEELVAPLRAYSIAGDVYAPPAAVARLPAYYPNATAEVVRLDPRTPGLAGLGHFTYFRPRYKALWDTARDWLLAAADGAARGDLAG